MKADRYKFRAWDGKKEVMLDVKEIEFYEKGRTWIRGTWFESPTRQGDYRIQIAKPHILMQSTGLLDKNGVEIFEGDVVTCKMSFENKSLPHMGEIVYMNQFGAFATKNLAGETLLHNHMLNTFKIIGNIWANPELTKEQK